MLRFSIWACLACGIFAAQPALAAKPEKPADAGIQEPAPGDWPWWRGPNRNGVAAADQNPPLEFSETRNVVWKAKVPGRGHSSPIVAGQRVFLATADPAEQVQSLLCFDRPTGRLLWNKEIHRGNFIKGGHQKSTHASSTPACDGERVFINFINDDAVRTTAVSVAGEQLWQTKISDYVLHQGYGSSPAIYGPLVIVMADNKGGGALAGLDRASGDIVWRQERPKLPNYPSPAILTIAGRDQVLMTGCDLVTSLDPLTGKKNWETAGATTECVTSAVTDGNLIFTSGGYPKKHMSAVRADGSGKVEWENAVQVYVPSMLVHEGHLYCVSDAGVAMCRDCATGKEVWSSRLGGKFTSSPVLVGDKVYCFSEEGQAFVFKASPAGFELLAENKLGDDVFASPAICGGQIFIRVSTGADEERQEWLYCLGNKD